MVIKLQKLELRFFLYFFINFRRAVIYLNFAYILFMIKRCQEYSQKDHKFKIFIEQFSIIIIIISYMYINFNIFIFIFMITQIKKNIFI